MKIRKEREEDDMFAKCMSEGKEVLICVFVCAHVCVCAPTGALQTARVHRRWSYSH